MKCERAVVPDGRTGLYPYQSSDRIFGIPAGGSTAPYGSCACAASFLEEAISDGRAPPARRDAGNYASIMSETEWLSECATTRAAAFQGKVTVI